MRMQPNEDSLSPDLEHWDAMLHGDKRAFSKLYELYFKVLYNYGRKLSSNAAHVEDAIHDLFVDLWRHRANLSATTSVRFYLYRSLRRRLLRGKTSMLLLTNEQAFFEGIFQHTVPSCEQEVMQVESDNRKATQLKKLLNDLSPRQYEALVLFFYDEFSYGEIAGLLNVNEQSARNLVQRGLQQLRNYARHIVFIGLLFVLAFA